MNKKHIYTAVLLVSMLLLGTAFRASSVFSEFYTLKIAPLFRMPISILSSFFPFSLGESFAVLLVILTLVTLISAIHKLFGVLFHKNVQTHLRSYSKIIFYCFFYIVVVFFLTFASSYSREPIGKTLGIKEVEMSKENICKALGRVTDELNSIAPQISVSPYTASYSRDSFEETANKVMEGAKSAYKKYPIYQKPFCVAKPVAFSEALAYTGISGVYTFFTGESNVNVAFSDYTLPFTMAHEYSHQMGMGSEKEAEFSALLICMECDDPYIRYSAYSQVAITLSNLLYDIDTEEFEKAFMKLPACLINDIYVSSENSKKYSETVADEIASAINDTYLSINGDEGVISYSQSSRLYVSYFLRSES